MVDVAENISYLSSSQAGDVIETKKFEDLKRVILECVGVILQKLGYLKLEIQTIVSSELMVEKKVICNVIIDISKDKDMNLPNSLHNPKLIAFHSNMDLLVWENCSKISILEDYVINASNIDKVLIIGVTIRNVQKLLSKLPAEIFTAHNDGGGKVDAPDITLTEPQATDTRVVDKDQSVSTIVQEVGLSPRGNSSSTDITSTSTSTPSPSLKSKAGSLTASIRKKLSVHVHAELSLSPRKSSTTVEMSGSISSSTASSSPKKPIPTFGTVNSRGSPSRALRSDFMTIRGTRTKLMQEMAEIESTVAKKMGESPELHQDQDRLMSELMKDQLDLDGLDMHKLHKKLTTLRKKGGRRDSDTAAVAVTVRDASEVKLSASTGSLEPGGHLLSLFQPPAGAVDSPVETRMRKNTIASPYKINPVGIDSDENPLIAKSSGYHIDIGHLFITHPPPAKQLTIIDTDLDIPHYTRDYFPHDHFNFLGMEKGTQQHALVSVLIRKCSSQGSKSFFELLVLIKTVEKDEPVSFTLSSKTENINAKKALKMVKKRVPKLSGFSLEEITDPDLKANLKDFELRQLKAQYRMGVLYCRNGQTLEDDMYSNVDPSPYFTEFLEVLGDAVDLQGFTKFKGGLDVRGGTTGKQSIYTTFHTYEIMFHVSTMLPFQPSDLQRVERKRHLGARRYPFRVGISLDVVDSVQGS